MGKFIKFICAGGLAYGSERECLIALDKIESVEFEEVEEPQFFGECFVVTIRSTGGHVFAKRFGRDCGQLALEEYNRILRELN